jgi:hypothetical protein
MRMSICRGLFGRSFLDYIQRILDFHTSPASLPSRYIDETTKTGRLKTYPLSENLSEKQGSGTPVDTGFDPADSDLGRVIEAWPMLPEPIRRAMLALIG